MKNDFKLYRNRETGEKVEAMFMIGKPSGGGWATYGYAVKKNDPPYLVPFYMEQHEFENQFLEIKQNENN